MKKIINKIQITTLVAVGVLVVAGAPTTYAALTYGSKLTQQINAGTLSTDIRDASGNVVANPSFALDPTSVSNSLQTTTGTFGSNTQRISVDNPGATQNWTLSLNATTPGTAKWVSGSNNYSYNGTSASGQLTVNPAAGTLVGVVPSGNTTGINKGTSTAFSGSTPITLLTASSAANIWQGYITGIGLSQTIPASTPAGAYSIDMTQTVAAS